YFHRGAYDYGCGVPFLVNSFQRCQDIFRNKFLTADVKLARFPARSPLPLAALPSMSLIPSAPLKLARYTSSQPQQDNSWIADHLRSVRVRTFSQPSFRVLRGPGNSSKAKAMRGCIAS